MAACDNPAAAGKTFARQAKPVAACLFRMN
jgi:hypothetical protein